MKYNKLVRDKIPEYIESKGEKVVYHVASDEEYWTKLKEKLTEEVEGFKKETSIDELADILEVLKAIENYKKFNKDEIERVRNNKVEKRGAFEKRIILDES